MNNFNIMVKMADELVENNPLHHTLLKAMQVHWPQTSHIAR